MGINFPGTPGCCGCGCDPTSTKICVTCTNHCGGAFVADATFTLTLDGVTIGTATTNASGHACIGVAKKGLYTLTVTKTGFCDSVQTFNLVACDVTPTISFELFPSTVRASFTALLTCADALTITCPSPPFTQHPSVDYPVTVDVTQTQGGSYTGSCTITSFDPTEECFLMLPAPCPGTVDNIFTVTFSSPGFQSSTGTITLPNSPSLWDCSTSLAGEAELLHGQWLFPLSNCVGNPPSEVTITITPGPSSCTPGGTWTLPLEDPGQEGCQCGASYKTTFVISETTWTVTVFIFQDPDSPGACKASASITDGSGGACSANFSMDSGTACCPIAWSGASSDSLASCTVSE